MSEPNKTVRQRDAIIVTRVALATIAVGVALGWQFVSAESEGFADQPTATGQGGKTTQLRSQQPTRPVDSSEKTGKGVEVNISHFLASYCADCHAGKEPKGGFEIAKMPNHITDQHTAQSWQDVLDVLNLSEMPPEDAEQLPSRELEAAINSLTESLFEARNRLGQSGRVVIRQLNRREYRNTIASLLGVHIDQSLLPEDGTYDGFDTVGKSHTLAPHYLNVYREVGYQALGDAANIRSIAPKRTQINLAQSRNDQLRKDIDRAVRLLNKRGTAPNLEPVRRNDRKLLAKLPFAVLYLSTPATENGVVLGMDKKEARIKIPAEYGRYTLRLQIALTKLAPEINYLVEVECIQESGGNTFNTLLRTLPVTWDQSAPRVIEFELERRSPGDLTVVLRLTRGVYKRLGSQGREAHEAVSKSVEEAIKSGRQFSGDIKEFNPQGAKWEPAIVQITNITLDGPYWENSTAGRAEFQYARALEGSAAESRGITGVRATIEGFAFKAFRHQTPNRLYIDGLIDIYKDYRSTGESHEAALRKTLAIILASPSFLYHAEQSPSPSVESKPLTNRELACRLSYMLWSSPPDEELYTLAESGRLSDPKVLATQVERLLADVRSRQFTDSFLTQWLGLDHLDMIVVNQDKFKGFSERIRKSFKQETKKFFTELVLHDLSALNLIDSDFIMTDDVMAEYYDLKNASAGYEVSRYKLPSESVRGGLLGQAAILTMTSNGERTSPIERGAFIARKLLGSPPPPPPPNVPQVDEDSSEVLTLRQKLEKHANTPQCASCHRRFDPYDVAMENFDAIGRWRTEEKLVGAAYAVALEQRGKNGTSLPVDSVAKLVSGEVVAGYDGLKRYLKKEQDRVTRTILKAMLVYSLGRRIGFLDEELIDDLQQDWKQRNHGMRSLVHLIVQSQAFRNK